MVYVNRSKFPINVQTSSYKKTEIEKLKVEKNIDEQIDYENITMDGFEQSHTLDVMGDTNVQQKSQVFYMKRQLSRLMYITKNIEIKPCLLMNQFLGFNHIYHMTDRVSDKEFYPVISIELLFSKTFMLEQNLPVFYNKFYSIVNQSNWNKIQSLEGSLMKLLDRIKQVKLTVMSQKTLENDQMRVKQVLNKLKQKDDLNQSNRTNKLSTDPVSASYYLKKLDEEKRDTEEKRRDCNSIYSDIKKQYDHHVFQNEICFYELFDKIKDIEQLVRYMQ